MSEHPLPGREDSLHTGNSTIVSSRTKPGQARPAIILCVRGEKPRGLTPLAAGNRGLQPPRAY